MIQWIDLKSGYMEVKMYSSHLCVIVVVALICICAMVMFALYMGEDGAILGSALAIFGVIVGAVAESIYKKKA